MSKKKRARQKPKTSWLLAAALVLGGSILVGVLASRQSASETGTALRDSDTAFSIPDLVGQPAPTFTAISVDGQPYTVTPGDGRPKAIIFYMGFR